MNTSSKRKAIQGSGGSAMTLKEQARKAAERIVGNAECATQFEFHNNEGYRDTILLNVEAGLIEFSHSLTTWTRCADRLPEYGRRVWLTWNGKVQNLPAFRERGETGDVWEWCDDGNAEPMPIELAGYWTYANPPLPPEDGQ